MLLALVAFAVATSPSSGRITINPPDNATGVGTASTITVETADPHPSIEVYEGNSGVRVAGTFEPSVPAPKGRAVLRFAPTHGLKPGTTYKVMIAGRTFSFTTKACPRVRLLAIDDVSV